MERLNKVSSDTWNCAICRDVMDSDTSISKRCFHVFHNVCIKKWVVDHNTCPSCRLEYFAPYELLPNPEFCEEYHQWLADPETYSLDKDSLRPQELRGKERQTEPTGEDIRRYFKYSNQGIQELPDNATPEQIAVAQKREDKADDLMIKRIALRQSEIRVDQEMIHEQNIKQFAALARIKEDHAEMNKVLDGELADNPHGRIVKDYEEKVEATKTKIENEICRLKTFQRRNHGGIRILRDLSIALGKYTPRFLEAGKTQERSHEESQELLRQIDSELVALLDSQPHAIRKLLGRIQEPPAHVPTPSRIPTSWKVAFAVGIVILGIGFRNKEPIRAFFFGSRLVKPLI